VLAERATPSLSELRVLLKPRVRRDEDGGVVPTGVGAVDRLIGGGLPRGRLTELCGPRSAGRTALSLAALAAATARRGEAAALVDVGTSLDVGRAEAAGVALERLLWVRPPANDARAGLQAADVILAAGGFALVVLDVGEAAPRIPDAGFLRLARAAEKARAALLLVAPRAHVIPGAFSSLRLEAGGHRAPRFIGAGAGRVLLGIDATLGVLRARGDGGEPRSAPREGAQAPVSFRLRDWDPPPGPVGGGAPEHGGR
jgi:recombination protein RecA